MMLPRPWGAAAALLLSRGRAGRADASSGSSTVMLCTTSIYADGFIYRNTTADGTTSTRLDGVAANVTFPLRLAVTSHDGGPLFPIQPAQAISAHVYRAINADLYINASAGACAPVGFAAGGNATLGAGETSWGFYSAYGNLVWYGRLPTGTTALATAVPIHIQGFQWLAVDGRPGLAQLYWNQTQYDRAAALGSQAGIDAATALFGMCASDPDATITV